MIVAVLKSMSSVNQMAAADWQTSAVFLNKTAVSALIQVPHFAKTTVYTEITCSLPAIILVVQNHIAVITTRQN